MGQACVLLVSSERVRLSAIIQSDLVYWMQTCGAICSQNPIAVKAIRLSFT